MAGAFQENDRPQRGPRSLQHAASIRHALDRKNGERGQVRDVLVSSSALSWTNWMLASPDRCQSAVIAAGRCGPNNGQAKRPEHTHTPTCPSDVAAVSQKCCRPGAYQYPVGTVMPMASNSLVASTSAEDRLPPTRATPGKCGRAVAELTTAHWSSVTLQALALVCPCPAPLRADGKSFKSFQKRAEFGG